MFRCLILDSRLRPSLTRQVDIYIQVSIPIDKCKWSNKNIVLIEITDNYYRMEAVIVLNNGNEHK